MHLFEIVIALTFLVFAFAFLAWVFLSGSSSKMKLELAYAHWSASNQADTDDFRDYSAQKSQAGQGSKQQGAEQETDVTPAPPPSSLRQRLSGLAERLTN